MPIRKHSSRKLSGRRRSGRKLSGGRKVRTGPRGGKYVLRAGQKVYLSGGLACSHRRKKKDPKCEDQAGCKWEERSGEKKGRCFDPTKQKKPAAVAKQKKPEKPAAAKKKKPAAAKKKKPEEKGGYQVVVRSPRGKDAGKVFFEIYKTILVTAKPGEEHEMRSFGGYWQRVCIYGQRYTIARNTIENKWEDFQMPMRGEDDEYFQGVETRNTEKEAIKYLQDQMQEVLNHFKDPQKAPTIVTDDEKYIYRNQWYPFTL